MGISRIDFDKLTEYLEWKIDQEGLSLREASVAAGISPATLHRVLRRKKGAAQLDMDILLRLAGWAGVPLENLLQPAEPKKSKATKHQSTPDVIEVHLRADKNLAPGAARAISMMVRTAYKQFASEEGKDK
jgi:transcriptional regulator with XRE-family HTH domain